jgi:hypothetical protein
MSELPRGIRNNNPGNLRWGVDWLGLVAESERSDPEFCQFVDPYCGYRALCLTLITYRQKYQLRTIDAIVRRYAPASENDTRAYIEAVANITHFDPKTTLPAWDTGLLSCFCRAITHHENGPGSRLGDMWHPAIVLQCAGFLSLAYAKEHF